MKKILLAWALIFFGLSMEAQFVDYHSTYEYKAAKEAPTQIVYGYVNTRNGWVRISIKVKEANNSILVVGYKEKDTSSFGGAFVTYGNPNPWRKCQTWAQEVSVYSDGREVANEFDYKASISGLGTVYF